MTIFANPSMTIDLSKDNPGILKSLDEGLLENNGAFSLNVWLHDYLLTARKESTLKWRDLTVTALNKWSNLVPPWCEE